MEFIIVTGMSGAGKSRAIDAMEDIGFYCVDNIPPKLISTFYDLCNQVKDNSMKKIAIVTDIRGGGMFSGLFEALDKLKENNCNYKILYLDSRDDVLVRRYKETRRKHPLSENYLGSVLEAVQFEREILKPIKERADYVIDTSYISTAQLKERIAEMFLEDSSGAIMVNCMSFGFKYGTPSEADLIFDVRCLPNPYYVEGLKLHTGLDNDVREYVMKWDQTKGFIERWISLIDYMLPLYRNEGKSQLVIAVGCTGGKHRSVALAQYLYKHMLDLKQRSNVYHRDIHKA